MKNQNRSKLKNNQVCRVKFKTYLGEEKTPKLAVFSDGEFFLFGTVCFDYEELTVVESFNIFEE